LVRTTVNIPAPLHRILREQSAAQGCSVEEFILMGLKMNLLKRRRRRTKKVQFPLITSKGPKVDLINEQIYEHVEFP